MPDRHRVRFVGRVPDVDKPAVIAWFRRLFQVLHDAPDNLQVEVEIRERDDPPSTNGRGD
jgi:hypothetical protein